MHCMVYEIIPIIASALGVLFESQLKICSDVSASADVPVYVRTCNCKQMHSKCV